MEYDENAALYAGASYVEPQDAGQYATELLIATDSEDESQPYDREGEGSCHGGREDSGAGRAFPGDGRSDRGTAPGEIF